ncbi:GL18364, partial [Drosophila persimilis]
GNQEEDDPAEHFEDYSDEPQDDYEEVMMVSHEGSGRGRSRGRHSNPTSYMESSSYYPPETDLDDAQGYDSAVAFSGQDNSISAVPTVDDFLDDANNHPSSGYGNFYDPYSSHEMASQPSPWQPSPTTASTSAGMANSWTARPTAPASSQPSKGIRLRPRSPGGRANKVRYVKLVTRKKRRNRERIRTKRYRP